MDHLWTPWRFAYISNAGKDNEACVFCTAQQQHDDESALIIHRATHAFLLLNVYPYTTGHLMVVTFRHIALLSDAAPDELNEVMQLAQRAQQALAEIYKPDGFNLGMNLGSCAGAGVAGHLHFHVLPRWTGDANFMSVIGETRVLPETLDQTYQKLRPFFS